jgi:hypothetical protein
MLMHQILRFIQKLGLAYAIGQMLFFIAVFAPRVFRVLERPIAAQLQGAIFPPYYTGGLLAVLAFLLAYLVDNALYAPRGDTRTRLVWTLGLAVFVVGVFAYSRFVVTPELDGLRPQLYVEGGPTPEAREAFDGLHKTSVRLNGAALLALLALLAIL